MDQPKDPSPTIEQHFAMVLEGLRMVSIAFHQLDAQFRAMKEVLGELHPELAVPLAMRIHKAQTDSVKEFETLVQILEFLRTNTSGPIQ